MKRAAQHAYYLLVSCVTMATAVWCLYLFLSGEGMLALGAAWGALAAFHQVSWEYVRFLE